MLPPSPRAEGDDGFQIKLVLPLPLLCARERKYGFSYRTSALCQKARGRREVIMATSLIAIYAMSRDRSAVFKSHVVPPPARLAELLPG
jgi:hypothetical protein